MLKIYLQKCEEGLRVSFALDAAELGREQVRISRQRAKGLRHI